MLRKQGVLTAVKEIVNRKGIPSPETDKELEAGATAAPQGVRSESGNSQKSVDR